MGGWSADAGRRCLLIAAALAAFVVLMVGVPSPEASAANAPATATPGGPTATVTPTFVWIIPAESQGAKNRLFVDPLERRFRFDYLDENNKLVPGTPVSVDTIRATDKVVTFKWADMNRVCETATPAPPGKGPVASPTPGHCPMFVWATLDRQRKQVRATLFRRTVSGRLVANVVSQQTPLPLPTAPDPSVAIQDYKMVPEVRIIQPNEQLSVKNNMPERCQVRFDSTKRPGKAPDADATDFDLGFIGSGQISRKFPRTPVPVGTPTATVTPPTLWNPGQHLYTVLCDGSSREIRGYIVVPDN
jgi:hypothetical protein